MRDERRESAVRNGGNDLILKVLLLCIRIITFIDISGIHTHPRRASAQPSTSTSTLRRPTTSTTNTATTTTTTTYDPSRDLSCNRQNAYYNCSPAIACPLTTIRLVHFRSADIRRRDMWHSLLEMLSRRVICTLIERPSVPQVLLINVSMTHQVSSTSSSYLQ